MHRRGILRSIAAAVAAAAGAIRLVPAARAQTRHIRLYVEMDIDPAQEREMLDLFHNQFVPEAVKHQGYMRVKLLKRRTILQGTAPAGHNYRFELEFESEELRQQWIASADHVKYWPMIENTVADKGYLVLLTDAV